MVYYVGFLFLGPLIVKRLGAIVISTEHRGSCKNPMVDRLVTKS